MSVPSVRPIWTPEDARRTAELAAQFPTEVGIMGSGSRWTERFARIRRLLTSWPVITLLPLLIIPVGLATPPRAQADSGDYLYQLHNDDVALFVGPDIQFLNSGHRICTASINGYSNAEIATYLDQKFYYDSTAANRLVELAEDYLC